MLCVSSPASKSERGETTFIATAATTKAHRITRIGSSSPTPCSPIRKYVAKHTAAPNPAAIPTTSKRRPCQMPVAAASPAIASASPTHIRPRTCSFWTTRAQIATRIGAWYSSSSAIPTGSRSIAT